MLRFDCKNREKELKALLNQVVKPRQQTCQTVVMVEYIKREMPDMNGTGERKAYYKVKTYSNLSSENFVKKICYPGSGLNQGDVAKVMCLMVDEMKRWLAEGHTITIDELGTFSLSIGVMDDEEVEDFDGNGKKVTAKRIGVRGVNFRPDKQLVRDIGRKCKLHKGYESPNNRSPYTRDQRLKMAQDYIAEHHFMRVRDYEAMTLLPHSTAAKELCDFCVQPTGITSEGRGNTKVYVKR